MKKKIFTLIINTVIFITNPLFAMEILEDQHACPTCKKDTVRFLLSKMEANEEEGNFNKLGEKNIIIYLISLIHLKDVYAISNTSKELYNICQDASIWISLTDKEKRFSILSHTKCPKMDFEKAYLNFLKTIPRRITVSLEGERLHYKRPGKETQSLPLDTHSLNIFQNFFNY